MEPVSSFFKVEKDIFYQVGEKRGLEKGLARGLEKGREKGREEGREEGREKGREEGKAEIVKNMLATGEFSITQLANLAGASEAFVRKVKKNLK
jgi:predicted transposase YdaD